MWYDPGNAMMLFPGGNPVLNTWTNVKNRFSRRNPFVERLETIGDVPLNLRDYTSPRLARKASKFYRDRFREVAAAHQESDELLPKPVVEAVNAWAALMEFQAAMTNVAHGRCWTWQTIGRRRMTMAVLKGQREFRAALPEYMATRLAKSAGSGRPGLTLEDITRSGMAKMDLELLCAVLGKPQAAKLAEELLEAVNQLQVVLAKAGVKPEPLWFSDAELVGLTPEVKTHFKSKKGQYKIPMGRGEAELMLSLCQSRETRERYFKGLHEPFNTAEVGESLLRVLRLRQKLARELGFESFLALKFAGTSIAGVAEARSVMDSVWKHLQAKLKLGMTQLESLRRRHIGAQQAKSQMDQVDGKFYEAQLRQVAVNVALAEYFPAEPTSQKVVVQVAALFGVQAERLEEEERKVMGGWTSDVQVFRVQDIDTQKHLGFIYVVPHEVTYRSFAGKSPQTPPSAQEIAPGHVLISLQQGRPGRGLGNLLNPDLIGVIAHETAHAIHFLVNPGIVHQAPDELMETPSVFTELLFLRSSTLASLGQHVQSKLPLGEEAAAAAAISRDEWWLANWLGNSSAVLAVDEVKDWETKTAADALATINHAFGRYSPYATHPSFSPLVWAAGESLTQAPDQILYLYCYIRGAAALKCKSKQSGKQFRKAVMELKDPPGGLWLPPMTNKPATTPAPSVEAALKSASPAVLVAELPRAPQKKVMRGR